MYLQQPLSPADTAVVSSVMNRQGALSSGSSKDDAHGNAAENQIAALDTDASLSAAQSGQPVLLADNIVDNSRAARKSQGNEASEPLLLSADGGEEPVCDLSPALTEPAGSAARSVQESSDSREASSVRSSSSSESHLKSMLLCLAVRRKSLSVRCPFLQPIHRLLQPSRPLPRAGR